MLTFSSEGKTEKLMLDVWMLHFSLRMLNISKIDLTFTSLRHFIWSYSFNNLYFQSFLSMSTVKSSGSALHY